MDVEVDGLKEVQKVLAGLPAQLNHRIVQAANAEAAKPLVERAKLLAPEGPTGRLVDSIGVVKLSLKKSSEIGEVNAGPRRGRFGGSHAHMVERGTVQRKNAKGANRGIMPVQKFMEPAFSATKDLVLSRINDALGSKLFQFMKRTIKSGGGKLV